MVADVNHDGKPDLLVANVNVTADGSVGGYGAGSLAVADVNGDGKPDVVVANLCVDTGCNEQGSVGVLLGNGNGKFQSVITYSAGAYSTDSVAVADINNDGKPDLLVASTCADPKCAKEGAIGVLLGNGDGTFQTVINYPSGGYWARSVAVADVNGDGIPDLLAANNCTTALTEQ